MNKHELIGAVASKAGISRKAAGAVVAALTDTVTEGLKAGEKVALPGLGTFEARTRAARRARNPRTGEAVDIAEKRLPVFKAGKALKDAVQ